MAALLEMVPTRAVIMWTGLFIADGEKRCYRIKIPKLEAQFYGPGDLFGILWLFWSIKHPEDMKVRAAVKL